MLALDAERRAYAARLERWLALASDEELALERTLARLTRTQRARQALDRLARTGEPSRLSQPPVAVKRRKKRPASDKGDDDKENRPVQPQPQKGEDAPCKLQPRSQQQAPTPPAHAPPRPPLSSLPQRSPPQPHRPPVPPPTPPTPPPPFHRHPPPPPPFPAFVAGLQFALESERAAVRRLSSAYAQLETSYASLRASHAELQHRVYELQAKNVALWAMADG